MSIAILDRYQLADDFEQRVTNFSFPAAVWNVAAELAEVNEAASRLQLEELTGQSPDQVREALERLLAKNLVRQNLVSWKEFTAAREKARGGTKTTAEAIPQKAAVEVAPVAAMPPERQQVMARPATAAWPTPPRAADAARTIASRKPAVGGTSGWVLHKPEAARVAASVTVIPAALPKGGQPEGRLLRPILAEIENIKGGVEGQLLVYQVFLRVPYKLLYEEGIKALHLVDEKTVIRNPDLHAAIVKAARDVTGVELT